MKTRQMNSDLEDTDTSNPGGKGDYRFCQIQK